MTDERAAKERAVNYETCPKCAHRPLPASQALPAACPACGLVLAKYRAAPLRPRPGKADAELHSVPAVSGSLRSLAASWLLHVPDKVSKLNWQGRVATLLVFVSWTLWIWHDADIPAGSSGSRFLHIVLTPFHEAGHYAIFRWFGEFVMTLGGTLGQHLMPAVLCVALLVKRHDPFGAALFFWLLGYSVMDMAVYMYDAYQPALMLLDGKTGEDSDGHDWQNILGDLGLLRRARGIGIFWGGVGRVLMLAALAWAAWVLWLQRARLSDSLFAEENAGRKQL
jgi:hypothetical protein